MDEEKKIQIQSDTFFRLINHLHDQKELQNIDLMNLAGFCRNCLARWYKESADKHGIDITAEEARELIYKMPYSKWKEKYQK